MSDKELIKLLLKMIELQEKNHQLELKQVRDNWNKKYGKLEGKLK